MNRALVFAVGVFISGCTYWARDSVSSGGSLCIGDVNFPDPNEQLELVADTPTTWTWVASGCMSGSCSRNPAATSSATVSNNVITVTTNATWEEARGMVVCTDDCRRLTSQFEMPALPPGNYRLKHDTREVTITVPSTSARCPMSQ
ncbi:MAG: hypothetical protein JNK82_38080 [Myxococcaceae bacterium]|nr:hypothetical protein [Myxococcaceae bacterium]